MADRVELGSRDRAAPFLGREAEVATLEELCTEAASGESRFALVHGEPGIGKTRLLSIAADRAAAAGFIVLEGSAAEYERELPFGVFIDAFDRHLRTLDVSSLDRLAADGLGELAAIFPALRGSQLATGPVGGAAERFRYHYAVGELIERLAARDPIWLSLDDMHWADPASCELVAHLLRRPLSAAAVTVISHRTGQADATLEAAIGSAQVAGNIAELALGPLDDGAAAELAGATPADLPELLRTSGGNPFYLLQLTRLAPAAARPSLKPGSAPEAVFVPRAVAASIARELDALSHPARSLAEAGAVAGDPFEVGLAASVASLDGAQAHAAVDELVARDLVRATGEPREFRFRHPLVRSAVYIGSGPGQRLTAHERTAEVLSARGEPASAFAHHLEASAQPGDAEAIGVLREAAAQVADRAPALAARWLDRGLALLPLGPDSDRQRVEFLDALGAQLMAAGQLTASGAAFERALELLPRTRERTRVLERCATVEILGGDQIAASARLREMLAAAEQPDERASALVALAITDYYSAEFDRMVGVAASAVAEAESPPLQAAANAAEVLALTASGRIEQARAACERTVASIDALSDEELASRMDAVLDVGIVELELDRPDMAVAHFRRGIELSRRYNVGHFLHHLLAWYAAAEVRRGSVRSALEPSEDAEQIARLTRSPLALMWALCWRSRVLLGLGERESALATAHEGLTLIPPARQPWTSAATGISLAAAMLESEDAGSPDALLGHCGGPNLENLGWPHRAEAYELLTCSAAARGDVEEALAWADRARAVAERLGLARALCCAQRAHAVAYRAADDEAGSVEAALEAVESGRGLPLDEAQSRLLAGVALAASNRPAAIEQLRRAEQAFDEMGARRLAQRTGRELRRLGVRNWRRGPSRSADSALSDREREVAVLAASGSTNRQIASELFLSVKTVETHLRNVYWKLGVNSRVGLAHRAELRDPGTP